MSENLTDEEKHEIVDEIKDDLYKSIGKGVVKKILWVTGAGVVAGVYYITHGHWPQ